MKQKSAKAEIPKSSTVPLLYLKEVSEYPQQFRELPSLFSSEGWKECSREPLSLCIKTSTSIGSSENIDERIRSSLFANHVESSS
jgi:hypothetical protein